MRAPARLASLLLAGALAACATARNYTDPAGPRFAGQFAGMPRRALIRVVSYNIKYGRNITGAAALLRGDVRLKDADVIALQEMDETGVDCLARTLALNYVYYPAAVHPADHRNFGNAILSPWPIEDDVKIVAPPPRPLPPDAAHRGGGHRPHRGDLPVRVFSVHLETPAGARPRGQARPGARDRGPAPGYPRVLVAGDFNGHGFIERVFPPVGFLWLTRDVGRTISRFSWDHLLTRGLRPVGCASVGLRAQRAQGQRPPPDLGRADAGMRPRRSRERRGA